MRVCCEACSLPPDGVRFVTIGPTPKGSMYILDNQKVMAAVAAFKATNFDTPEQGDEFFGRFAPGNTLADADRPFEGFSDYEELLFLLMKTDHVKYRRMHKGTAFGFMSWLAFDLRN